MIGERELDSLFLFESDRLFALLSGLNDKDRARVLRQLYIISHSSGSYEKKYIPKSEEEKEGIKRLQDLRASIKAVSLDKDSENSEEVYEYDGMFLPINSFEASVFLHHHLVEKCIGLDKGKAVIDAGGYIGDSALVFTKKCGISGQIYSFEPVSENFSLMQRTIRLNNLSNVTPVKKALGAKAGIAKISICNIASGFGHGDNLPTESVEVTTIDDFVRENALQVGLIKSDVEGFEKELLRGAVETIKAQRPFMIISIYHSLGDYLEIKPFLEALNREHDLGYSFSIDKGIDEYVHIDTCLYCVPGR